MERKSFVFYRSFYESINELEIEDQTIIIKAIMEYALNGNEPKLKGSNSSIFKLIKPLIDTNNNKYENGKKGGRPPKKNNLEETKKKPNDNQSVTQCIMSNELCIMSNVDVDVDEVGFSTNENVAEPPTATTFSFPFSNEVVTYGIEELGLEKEYCENFFNHYEIVGWKKKNGQLITNWKAMLKKWADEDKLKEMQEPKRRYL